MAFLDILKTRRITDSTFKLYKHNLEKLNDGNEIKNINFLKSKSTVLGKLEKYSPNTRRNFIIAIVSILKLLPKQEKLYNEYYDLLKEMNNEGRENPEKSEKQKENWMSQDEVMEVYKKLEEETAPLFLKKKLADSEYSKVLDFVLLSLYVLQQPRRNADYQKMMVVKKWDDKMSQENNYLDLAKNQFVFCNYKTQKTYHTKTEDIPEPLKEIIIKYLKIHPLRKEKAPYCFLSKSDGTCLKNINDITKRLNHIFGKKVGASLLRNIFATDKFSKVKKELEETADAMGTSVSMLMNQYTKTD
jgi:hypothetical protein